MERFKSIGDVVSSNLLSGDSGARQIIDRVLKSTKIEQEIFEDLSEDIPELADYAEKGKKKLKSFESLIEDVFQSIYGLKPRYVDEDKMSQLAKKFNKTILSDLMADDNYSAVKSVCEGKELPAIGATEEFTKSLLENLAGIMNKAAAGKGQVNGLDTMEQDKEQLLQTLQDLIRDMGNALPGQAEAIEQKAIRTANKIAEKEEQIQNFSKIIQGGFKKNGVKIKEFVASAVNSALERADEIKSAVMAWGNGDSNMQKNPVHTEILKRTAASSKLKYIARFLGRYKEMLNSKRLAGYTYGRGEKYDIEYGNTINRALTSELSLLATPELVPLFLKKYQNKALKQYRKREPEYKGKGDIIVCLDESGSTYGENSAYGMAIAMVLYEICRINHTNFALVHFACDTKVDYFPKDEPCDPKKVLDCAETFLNGGTDFEAPLSEVFSLYASGKLEKADIVFITDGECDVSDEFLALFDKFKADTGSRLTGILLDQGSHFAFSLEKLADQVYRTSELLHDEIMENVIDGRI